MTSTRGVIRSVLLGVGLTIAVGAMRDGSRVTAQQADGISPQALAQIAALNAEKASRTPAQQKISSRLLHAAKIARGEPIANGLQTLEIRLPDVNAVGAVVDVRVEVSQSLLNDMVRLGAELLDVNAQYQNVRVRIDLNQLEAIAAPRRFRSFNRSRKRRRERTRRRRATGAWQQRVVALRAHKQVDCADDAALGPP